MKSRRRFLTTLALPAIFGAAVLFTGASHAGPDKSPVAVVGKTAPNFTLKDSKGKAHTLADHQGKIVVLQWINPGCPVCKRVHTKGVVKRMNEELVTIDDSIVVLAIDSTHYGDISKSAAYLADSGFKTPALDDRDGTVGRMYGAKTTPHVFVIDTEGILRYQGAIDDDRSGKKGDEATNYVVNAVRQLKAGETVAPDFIKSYGCSVKYAKK